MIRVRIRREAVAYEVRVGNGLLARAGAHARRVHDGGMVALVTDQTVGRLYGARAVASLERAGFRVVAVALPDGESAKSFGSYRRLCERWSRSGVGRDAVVVALGGGVVSDVAGFAASTFARGLPWIAFPTTVLAQADASIGGKVGINLAGGKNLVGAFHHPLAVFADTDALRTLSPRAYRSGLAEIAKMGIIRRPAILTRLARVGLPNPRESRAIEPLIRMAAAEKAWFVQRDERDAGIRMVLNFGHTVGHALEAASGYRRYFHGEAVSIGMVAALRLSVLEAGLDPVSALTAESLLRRLGLPTVLPKEPGATFWRALGRDKKRGRKHLRVVLCPRLGASKVFELPSLTTLRRVVRSLVRQGVNP
jgi:3-dehydroquinate synthase